MQCEDSSEDPCEDSSEDPYDNSSDSSSCDSYDKNGFKFDRQYKHVEKANRQVWANVIGMPARFEAVIILFSDSNNYEKAILEWTNLNKYPTMMTRKCICSHRIKELVYIRHKRTNQQLIIGNECINKLKSAKLERRLKIISHMCERLEKDGHLNNTCLHCGNNSLSALNLYCHACVKNDLATQSKVVRQQLDLWTNSQSKKSYAKGASEKTIVRNSDNDDQQDLERVRQQIADHKLYMAQKKSYCESPSLAKCLPNHNQRQCARIGCCVLLTDNTPAHHRYCCYRCFTSDQSFFIPTEQYVLTIPPDSMVARLRRGIQTHKQVVTHNERRCIQLGCFALLPSTMPLYCKYCRACYSNKT